MIRFEVLGNPVTQGSGKAINDRAGRARFIPDHRAPLAAWRTDIHNVDTWVWGRRPDGSHSFMAPVHVLDAIEVRGWVWTWGTDDAWICTRDYTASRISFVMPRRPNEHREVMLYRVFVEAVKGARK